ncbi:LysR family transcriptional regulator [Streptomyces fuscigenes]|uniref:LysR family transcriptional regulator n=1 Tax=Streptomyces fuscigenes TaxID=1528880 RepID=UPI001F43D90B|nr:LysR family transcriptional regulator [Streptomyces fuscigenes]MCF3963534.1 LysR family transcriptional regulator [Streptomyces fuscigenes]
MELRHLEYFVAVAEERHFTRAAQRLMVSQSGLSASVRALERELDAALFVRSTRRVELTEAGRALFVEASRALASVRSAKEAVAAVQGLLRGTLSVGTEQCIAGVDVPSLLARFRSEHPEVEIRLRQAGSAALADDVAEGRLDLAFVALSCSVPDGIRLLPIGRDRMVLLCRPEHPLAGREGVPWSDLGGETFVDFHADWGARRRTDQAFAASGTQRRVALEVNDVHTLIELVGHGLGVAVVPRPVALKPQAAGLCTVELTGADTCVWEVSAAVPDDRRTTPAARQLLSYLPAAARSADVSTGDGGPTGPGPGHAEGTGGEGAGTGGGPVIPVPAPRG